MSHVIGPVTRAANDLTARWCALLDTEDFVASAAGVWPLLGLLASAADEPARDDLATALGRSPDTAPRDALRLIDTLRTGESTTAALGVWTRNDVVLNEDWSSQLPDRVLGELTDQDALDTWTAAETDGLIERFPVRIGPGTRLVMASALALRLTWRTPFDSFARQPDSVESAPDEQWLTRTTHDLDDVAVLDNSVTRVVVQGDGDVDVHLLIGDQSSADVLGVGLRELSGEAHVAPGASLDADAPGLTVTQRASSRPSNELRLRVPSFEINTHHDLLDFTDLFGLGTLTDPGTSHLPLLSPEPLFISAGAQDVLARFFAEGFEAAAVTGFAMMTAGLPPAERHTITVVDVNLDRPFGFIAVHRPSRLAIVAGWVSTPFG